MPIERPAGGIGATASLAESAPLWRLGFRPFYLAASAYASLSIAVWALQYAGVLHTAALAGPLGHAHEMLFGFAFAVVAGFLFTAGRNWTGRPTPSGGLLIAIVALWLLGRVLNHVTTSPWLVAFVDGAFPVVVAAGLARPLFASGNRRNYFFVAILVAAGIADGLVHLGAAGRVTMPAWLGIRVALDLVLFVMAVMGGRVIPMFTNNGVPGAGARRVSGIERAALGSLIALLAADVLPLEGPALAWVLGFAAIAHGARLALWQPLRTLRTPIVWALHVGYAWIPVHLALRALAELGLVPPPAATHALTAGAIGGLTMAMMTRTARGHTGLPLVADRADVIAYALVLAAALIRVAGPLLAPRGTLMWIAMSATAWSLAFGLYFVAYLPRLTAPRVDGKPG